MFLLHFYWETFTLLDKLARGIPLNIFVHIYLQGKKEGKLMKMHSCRHTVFRVFTWRNSDRSQTVEWNVSWTINTVERSTDWREQTFKSSHVQATAMLMVLSWGVFEWSWVHSIDEQKCMSFLSVRWCDMAVSLESSVSAVAVQIEFKLTGHTGFRTYK